MLYSSRRSIISLRKHPVAISSTATLLDIGIHVRALLQQTLLSFGACIITADIGPTHGLFCGRPTVLNSITSN